MQLDAAFLFLFFVSHNSLSRWEGNILYPTIDMAVAPISSHERDQCHGTLAASSLFFASRSSPPDFLFLGDCNGLSGVFPANRCTLMGGNKRPVYTPQKEWNAPETSPDPFRFLLPRSRFFTHGCVTLSPSLFPRSSRPYNLQLQSTLADEMVPQNVSSSPVLHDQESTFEEIHADAHPIIAPSDYSYEVVHETDDITAPVATWEEHEARSTPSSIGSGPFQDNIAKASPPPEPSDSASDGDEVVLPPNWSATTNNQGRLYYYNVVTKETSWKLPSANSTPTEPSTEQTHVNPSALTDESSPQVLPLGWSSAHGK